MKKQVTPSQMTYADASNVPQMTAAVRLPRRARNAKMDALVKRATSDDELAHIAQERLRNKSDAVEVDVDEI